MALDSVTQGQLFLGYPERCWLHPAEALSPYFHPENTMHPKYSSRSSWSKQRSPKVRRSTYTPRMEQIPAWGAKTHSREPELKNGHLSWKPYGYQPSGLSSADASVTSAMTEIGQLPWQPFAYENKEQPLIDVRMTSNVTQNDPKSPQPFMYAPNDQQTAADFNMTFAMTSMRERSRSMGSWRSIAASRASSGSNLVGGGISGYESSASGVRQRSEVMFETMRTNLMKLWMSRSSAGTPGHGDTDSKKDASRRFSPPESPSSATEFEDVAWKDQRIDQRSSSSSSQVGLLPRQRYDDLPIDMTSRKRKLKGASPEPAESVDSCVITAWSSPLVSRHVQSGQDIQGEGLSEFAEPSILRSMLTERGRSNSMSVLEMRRRRILADRLGSNLSESSSTTVASSGERQWVTLAKKNLLPVSARITDLLGRIVDFAKSYPEFLKLPQDDQQTLLISSCLRLLVLGMAETNLQFATTVVAGDTTFAEGDQVVDEAQPGGIRDSKVPTLQFVCGVQHFVRKCQALNVSGDEYFHMKLITLFHSGVGSLECTRVANRINSSARQDLQDLVSRSHPSERLRYSTLLLSLHTLFGIHCGMLQSLFCQHLEKLGGIKVFVAEALSKAAVRTRQQLT